jgi:thymidine phosphorylase
MTAERQSREDMASRDELQRLTETVAENARLVIRSNEEVTSEARRLAESLATLKKSFEKLDFMVVDEGGEHTVVSRLKELERSRSRMDESARNRIAVWVAIITMIGLIAASAVLLFKKGTS